MVISDVDGNSRFGLRMRRLKLSVWVVGLLLTLMALNASAQDSREANRWVQTGNQSLAQGEFEDALVAYTKALELSEDPELVYQVGDVQEKLGNWESAKFHFQLYLNLVPNSRHSEKIGARIEVLRTLESTQSRLEVVSDPEGASVYWLGERAVGRTPARIPVHPGQHRLRFEKQGFKSAFVEVEVFAGQERTVEVELSQLPEVKVPEKVPEPVLLEKEKTKVSKALDKPVVSEVLVSNVDLSPPGAVRTFGWMGLVGGFWALALGWAADVPSVWISGTLMMGGSGYLLFIHEWDDLPTHETGAMPIGGFSFEW